MIVYNVDRNWFAEKVAAEAYRRKRGLPPSMTIKLDVRDRDNLCALLNALCDPPAVGAPAPATDALIERAFVDPNLVVPDYVPLFLISDPHERDRVKLDREERRAFLAQRHK